MTHAPLCVLCLKPNTTNLVLCADCEMQMQESRKRSGLPVRLGKVLKGHDEPDD